MAERVKINDRWVGHGLPCFVIAEIGLNHNGEIQLAKKLIDAAALAGCDAVKFQKRTPELCVPPEQRDIPRETPWGTMSYLEYRHRVEFRAEHYRELDRYCREKEMIWFASCWDEPSVDFIEQFSPACYKVASASLTDAALLRHTRDTGRPVIVSTGMSTLDEIDAAVALLDRERLLIAHATSTYPCPNDELNLRMIASLRERYDVPVGYSGHEVGLQTTCAAVALGACFVERHITLDRAMWGSDQAASVEPGGFSRLVRDIRIIEHAMGDGRKRVYDSELPIRNRLRRASTSVSAGRAGTTGFSANPSGTRSIQGDPAELLRPSTLPPPRSGPASHRPTSIIERAHEDANHQPSRLCSGPMAIGAGRECDEASRAIAHREHA